MSAWHTNCAATAAVPCNYDVIYLSPHPDDAVFSCGGDIARRVAKGEHALIVTVCTAMPNTSVRTTFAETLHQRWNLASGEVVQTRVAENAAALASLGADGLDLNQLDAIYRLPDLYDAHERLFGTIAAGDALPDALSQLVCDLAGRYPRARLYAPLGVACHVDHQAAHLAARRVQRQGMYVLFYEDLPYATEPGSVERQLQRLGVDARATPFSENIEAFIARKIAAMRCYASQVQDLPRMPDEAAAYARSLSLNGSAVERTWCLP